MPPARSLYKDFMSVKGHYDLSVREFEKINTEGRYDKESAMSLYIRKIVGVENNLVHVVGYDLKEKLERHVLFRPFNRAEFVEGIIVILFPPWRNVQLPNSDETIIINTHFHQVVKPEMFRLTTERINRIKDRPMPSTSGINSTCPVFMDIVPFHIQNQNKIELQMNQYKDEITVDVAILYSWTMCNSVVYLLKDADKFLSFLEVPNRWTSKVELLQHGHTVQISNLTGGTKTLKNQKIAPFSILRLFGGNQLLFYTFRWSSKSMAHFKAFPIHAAASRDFFMTTGFEKLSSVKRPADRRVSIKCIIKEVEDDCIFVTDDSMTETLAIHYAPNCKHQRLDGKYGKGEVFIFRFLRVVSCKAIWDSYTTYELSDDEEFTQD